MRIPRKLRLYGSFALALGAAFVLFFLLSRPVVLSVKLTDPGMVFVGSELPLKAILKVRHSGISRSSGQVLREPATDNVTWTSSDTAVATVSTNGILDVLAPGNTTITVTAKSSGRSDSVVIRASSRVTEEKR